MVPIPTPASAAIYAADTVSAAPVLSIAPVVLPAPGRAVDLQVQVSAPVTGSELPIILLSHGHGPSNHLSSLNGYGPLTNFWAAHGLTGSREAGADPDRARQVEVLASRGANRNCKLRHFATV
jgi:predicted dienelactone hydrolase